jgi:hypothetical protein
MKAYGSSGGKLGIMWRCVVSRVPRYWDLCTYGYPTSTYSQLPFAAPQPITLPNYFQCTFHYVTVIPDVGLKDDEIKYRDNFTFTFVLADYRRNYTGTTFLLLLCLQITEEITQGQLYFYFCDSRLQKNYLQGQLYFYLCDSRLQNSNCSVIRNRYKNFVC